MDALLKESSLTTFRMLEDVREPDRTCEPKPLTAEFHFLKAARFLTWARQEQETVRQAFKAGPELRASTIALSSLRCEHYTLSARIEHRHARRMRRDFGR